MKQLSKALFSSRSAAGIPYACAALLAAVTAFRLYYCFQLPANTGDAVRHICWGLIVNAQGYTAIGNPLRSLAPSLSFVSWSVLPYNYPIMSLLFDQLSAAIYPSVLVMKLLLTAIEALNALLVQKYTGSWWLALLYWGAPMSVWWVSHEGQFETLQNLFVLLALLAFRDEPRRSAAYFLLGLGVQTKLTAAFLLPYFLLRERKIAHLAGRFGALALSFIPSLLTALVANPFALLSKSATMAYNPYYFNFLDQDMFQWNPPWLIAGNAAASYGLLIALLVYGLSRRQRLPEVLPAVLLLLFIKLSPIAQFWYMLTVFPFLLIISDRRARNLLLCASQALLDIHSALQILFGPFGHVVGSYYDRLGHGVWTDIRTLFR